MWPFRRREKRDSGGDFSDAVVRLIEAQAAGTAADASSTAAVEAASGALSRAFASARVEGPPHVLEAVTPVFLAQAGRDLVRSGDSMHVIDVDRTGRVSLLPCSSWHFEGDAHPRTWTVRATYYGPSTSTTRHLPFAGVVFVRWGSTRGSGRSPGRTPRPVYRARPSAPWTMRRAVPWLSSYPFPRTAVTTLRTIPWGNSRRTYGQLGAGLCWSRPWPLDGERAGQALRNATGWLRV